MAYPNLALRSTRNGLISHYIVAGSKNPLSSDMGSVKDDEKLIDDHTLVALTIMIAESKPEEKDMMITVIMNCLR